jgi:hypothetical protein
MSKQANRMDLTLAMNALERHLSPALCTALECYFDAMAGVAQSHGGNADRVNLNIAECLKSMVSERREPPERLTCGIAI